MSGGGSTATSEKGVSTHEEAEGAGSLKSTTERMSVE